MVVYTEVVKGKTPGGQVKLSALPLMEELGHLFLHLFALQLLLQQELETCHRVPLRVLLIRLRREES